MMRMCVSFVLLGGAVALAGCNETAGGGAGPSFETPPSPVVMSLPRGAACTTEIDTYQKVVKSDLATGNVEDKVYDQIERELARAEAACAAGKGGEAHAIVLSSKSKHGYRA